MAPGTSISKVVLRDKKRRYVVKKKADWLRLLRKKGQEEGDVQLEAYPTEVVNRRGRELAQEVEDLYEAGSGWKQVTTWSSLSERCGARSREKGGVCYAKNHSGCQTPISPLQKVKKLREFKQSILEPKHKKENNLRKNGEKSTKRSLCFSRTEDYIRKSSSPYCKSVSPSAQSLVEAATPHNPKQERSRNQE